MSLLAAAAEERLRQPAECMVELDGSEMVDLYPALVEVRVESERGSATEAVLVLETRRLEDGTWTVQDDRRFTPWVLVKISAVFGGEPAEIMRGYVREVKAEYPEQKGAAKVTVTCQDHSLLLDREHVTTTWGVEQAVSDGDIVRRIVNRHQLQLDGEPAVGQTSSQLHQNETDSRFLSKRAENNGYELVYSRGMVYFGPMRLDGEPQPTILVYAGSDTHCIRFELQDDGHKPDQVAYEIAASTGSEPQPRTVRPNLTRLGPEPADSTRSGLGDFVWRPQRSGDSDEASMQARAQAMANEQSMKIKVDGELDGSLYGHVLEVAKTVGVDGVGERHSGIYYVDMANHTFDVNGYRITFRLLRNAYGDNLPARDDPLAGVR
jgi:phage protein D